MFPATYRETYTQVRNCRPSIEHGAVNILVLASPEALTAYTGRAEPFATGAILLKEEYGSSDQTCSGAIRAWTVMEKLDDGSSTAALDWHWQKVGANRTTMTSNDPACITCHAKCDPSSDGYLHTCTVP